VAADRDRRADAQRGRGDLALTRGTLTLVLDASVAFQACIALESFAVFGRERLVAPPLLWPEVRSSLHAALWRREISPALARIALEQLQAAPIASRSPAGLGMEAWRIADEFGWAKTYDAEYVALAALLRCRLVTADDALRRATARLGFVIGPTQF
jgi:predicted nucleic acid-binding protein